MGEFVPGSALSVAFFLLVVFAVLVMMLWGAGKADRPFRSRISLFLVAWLTGFSLLVLSGLLQRFTIPLVPLMFLCILASGVLLGLSQFFRPYLSLPVWYLLVFQAFRLPLELVLHLWAGSGTVPETMTWTGQNWDIVSGILPLFFLIPFFRRPLFFWLVNLSGILLLLNVIRVVIMSSPFPFAWELEHPVRLIFYMPYALIGFVCVWAAVLGHTLATRSLLNLERP